MEQGLDWKNFKMPWGKYHKKGWTMWQIYYNDFTYISNFLIPECNDPEVLAAAQAAMEHKDRVDPYAQY